MNANSTRWTNKSVLAFAEGQDPVKQIEKKAREIAIRAMDQGWSGPPYDPIRLADTLKTPVAPRDDIRDARTVPMGAKGTLIEFNPNVPRWRVRFSIAHEIAHTFFPDCTERVRNRESHVEIRGDEWQLEFLCNIAAAELIMPVGSFTSLKIDKLNIEHLMRLRQEYDVSTEALLLRIAKLTDDPCAVFFSTRMESGSHKNSYRVDYVVPSRSFSVSISGGYYLPHDSVLGECTAIGFTASAVEKWTNESPKYSIECVGIPPFPGSNYPRVAGFLKPTSHQDVTARSNLMMVRGDALSPRGIGHKVIAHIINDKTLVWGGRSFAANLRRKWPEVQKDFQEWVRTQRTEFTIGSVRTYPVDDSNTIVSMVAQKGIGPSDAPRIRYWALESCLQQLGRIAKELRATIHMPRIGTGNAGGSWEVIEELIDDNLCRQGLPVTVYSLPEHMATEAVDRFLVGASE